MATSSSKPYFSVTPESRHTKWRGMCERSLHSSLIFGLTIVPTRLLARKLQVHDPAIPAILRRAGSARSAVSPAVDGFPAQNGACFGPGDCRLGTAELGGHIANPRLQPREQIAQRLVDRAVRRRCQQRHMRDARCLDR